MPTTSALGRYAFGVELASESRVRHAGGDCPGNPGTHLGVHLPGPAHNDTLGYPLRHALTCAFGNKLALQLGEYCDDAGHGFAVRAGKVQTQV